MNTTGITGHTRQINVLSLLMSNRTVPHTMLFSGKSGIGKKLIARQFLAALFCRADDPPCRHCTTCIQIAGGAFPDIIELLPDEKGTIPIGSPDKSEPGSVRWLIDRLSKKSMSGKYGVLIDGAEAISTAGQNALLKTIEEPQSGARIIIITANKSLILPTIMSRCMELPFNSLTADEVKLVLAKSGEHEGDIDLIAEISGGSIETALLLLQDNMLKSIADICRDISSSLAGSASLGLDLAFIQKKITMDQLLSVLVTLYRTVLMSMIMNTPLHPFYADFQVPDRRILEKLIKILLALRKGLTNNLNIRNTLKGMIYAIDSIDEFGLPKLDLTE